MSDHEIDWHEVFEYRDDGFLVWKNHRSSNARKGMVAGCKGRIGYFYVSFFEKRLLAHRIIFEMFNGKIPPKMEVDHINGVRHDNRIENLRLSTRGQNARNLQSRRADNKSGFRNVYWFKSRKKWVVQLQIDGSKRTLGYFDLLEEAADFAKLKRFQFYGEFSGS